MNKKLFSWKALAGLALLVAMGLTSCKQGAEVDPSNPIPAKPVTPKAEGTALSGVKTVAELNTLIAGTKDITDNIKADGVANITVDASNLEIAAGDKLTIPGATDATINLVFSNKPKKNDGLIIADDALDILNITFPEGEFGDVSFEMPYSKLAINSAGASTLGNVAFNVNKNDMTDLATTIGKGIKINSVKTWYVDDSDVFQSAGRILIEEGAEIVALTIDEDYYNNWGIISNGSKGYSVNGVYTDLANWDAYYVKNLNVVSNQVAVGAYEYNDQVIVEKITIAKGDTVTINGGYAKEIVGLGEGSALTKFNDTPAEYSNLSIDGQGNSYGSSNDPIEATLKNCTLVDFNRIYLSQNAATKLVFTQDDNAASTTVYYPVYAGASDESYTYTFDGCEFTSTKINAFSEGVNVLGKDGKPIKQTLYQYGWDDPDDDPDAGYIYKDGLEKMSDIPEAVRKGETGWYSSYTYEPKVYAFTDLALIPSFSTCKVDDVALTGKNVDDVLNYTSLTGADGVAVATTTQVKINDKLYKRIYTKTNGWILVEE